MRVAIAGAGAVGRSIAGELLENGHDVLLIDHSPRAIKVDSVPRAEWLLADMLLFFVPAALAVLNHPEFLGLTGLKILFVILASTVAVMVTTALVVDGACRRGAAHGLALSDPR